MSTLGFLVLCSSYALPLGIGLWIGLTYAPSDVPQPHVGCSRCKWHSQQIEDACCHFAEPHKTSGPRGPLGNAKGRR